MTLGLAISSGVVALPSVEAIQAEDRVVAAMILEARAFLGAGGVLSWRDWREMDDSERAAFVEAGKTLAAERAAQTGIASQSLAGAIQVGSEADGGEAAKHLGMEAALQTVVAAARGEGPPK